MSQHPDILTSKDIVGPSLHLLDFNFSLYNSNHVANVCAPVYESDGTPKCDEILIDDILLRNMSLIWKTLKMASNLLDVSIKPSSETHTQVDNMLASLRPLISTPWNDGAYMSTHDDNQTIVHTSDRDDDEKMNVES